jgi:peptidoglycan hydrolase-like protein with peptidoglycan-binding domain
MYPAHVPQKNYVNNSFNKGDVLPTPIIPEFIIVHDGLPTDSSADNHYVLYTDYIKNVASHEVYSTWPEESLKANIYCILSYTMNRIYTEWYPSNGYDFTITSSTQFDHKYVHGGTVYESISLLVDEIFMNYIKLKDSISPFLAQYNDGIKINHVGWLSQWGSKDLAEKGYSAEDIIKHYYGDGVGLVTADLIAGMPNSFPGYNLTMNIKSKAVQQIQIELNTISSSYPIIPKIPPTNGIYEQSTRNSVEVFQKQFSLPVTGVVDFTTWYKISLIFIGVTKALEGVFKLS